MQNYILGLDLGTNSIGWAAVGCDEEDNPKHLINANSRIFLAMIEADTKVPKNKKRREKRLARRQLSRYKERRANLLNILIPKGFLPVEMSNGQGWEKNLNILGNPFELRAKALHASLTPHELGRVFLHLLRRRGYKSNRGIKYQELLKDLKNRDIPISFRDEETVQEADPDNPNLDIEKARETGQVLSGIRLLKQAMQEKGCETIGQFMVMLREEEEESTGKINSTKPAPRRPYTISRSEVSKQGKETSYHLHATRELYEAEFEKIWDQQAKPHENLLTPQLKTEIFNAVFHQRPLQLQKNKVGKCSVKINKPRAAKALPESQEYRVLEDINNLQYSLPRTGGAERLSPTQREKLLAALADPKIVDNKDRLSWADVKKLLGLESKVKFNLERTNKSGLHGNRTDLALARTIPDHWGNFTVSQKKSLVNDLLNIHDKVALFNRLINRYLLPEARCPWHFNHQEAFALATLELDEGYMKHCFEVINNLLPHLRNGMIYTDAMLAEGYLGQNSQQIRGQDLLEMPPDIANPVVQKALFETRRVVNAIIQKYGRPKIVRIEMARDMKASKAHRAEMDSRNKANQKANEKAAGELEKWNQANPGQTIQINRESVIRYKLLREQNDTCPYCAHPMTLNMLADGAVDIDHIYPLSRSAMNDYMNKVLAHNTCNREKGNQTPYEAWHGTDKYRQILATVEKWYKPKSPLESKLAKFREADFAGKEQDFVAAQLNDTRYICVAVMNYLKTLGYDDQHIQVSRGQATAELRRLWGLSKILPKAPEIQTSGNDISESTSSDEEAPEKTKKKDRGDHRHHAIDAIVTALTSRQTFADLMRRYRYYEKTGSWPEKPLDKPWDTLREDVKIIVMHNVVSHSTNRKVSGGLHDELPYGLGYYVESEVSLKKLVKKSEIILALPDKDPDKKPEGSESWVHEAGFREILQTWWRNREKAHNVKDFPPPLMPDGTEITVADVAHRCYLKRVPVDKALDRVKNEPGNKTWIVDPDARKVLQAWLKTPGNSAKTASINPPLMARRSGNVSRANPIKTVRLASKSTGMVRFGDKPQLFEKSSNHHVAVFRRIVNGETVERKGIFVDMLEAARRTRKPPIVRKDPRELMNLDPSINPAEWQFEMFLCNNDMVLWDTDDPDWQNNNKKDLADENHDLPIYRLQKMTEGQLTFRHFSVTSTAGTDNRGVIRRSPTKLRCKKIRIDELGEYEPIT